MAFKNKIISKLFITEAPYLFIIKKMNMAYTSETRNIIINEEKSIKYQKSGLTEETARKLHYKLSQKMETRNYLLNLN
ncbi:hypothetical protein A9996_18185 [Gelidibacter algens]|nr:hypothetical protein A9996_18185 [Gelidibacter algens]